MRMATEETRKRLVDVTYRIMKESGFENLKAREIAREAGCTATVIYKYFDDLYYLITLASFKFLEDYIRESEKISRSGDNSIVQNKKAWRLFIKYAFQNPRIYENLFWGRGKMVYEDAVSEYFDLYADEISKESTAYYYITMFNADIGERDLIWLRRGVNQGYLEMEDALYISRVNQMIVRGMLLEHMDDYMVPGVAERAIDECICLVEKTIDTYLKK